MLVRPAGLEPATNGLGNRCSIQTELRAHTRFSSPLSSREIRTTNALNAWLPFLTPLWLERIIIHIRFFWNNFPAEQMGLLPATPFNFEEFS